MQASGAMKQFLADTALLSAWIECRQTASGCQFDRSWLKVMPWLPKFYLDLVANASCPGRRRVTFFAVAANVLTADRVGQQRTREQGIAIFPEFEAFRRQLGVPPGHCRQSAHPPNSLPAREPRSLRRNGDRPKGKQDVAHGEQRTAAAGELAEQGRCGQGKRRSWRAPAMP